MLIQGLGNAGFPQRNVQSAPAKPAPASQDQIAKVDQILKECSALQTNGSFDELGRKAAEAIRLSKDLGDQLRTSRSLSYMGAAEYYQGRLQEALGHQQQAAALSQASGNKRFYGIALNNIGATLNAMGRYEEALFYFNKTIELAKQINDRDSIWAATRSIGDLHQRLGDLDKADATLQEALAIARESKNKIFEEATLLTLIGLRTATKQYQEALAYCDQAAQLDAVVKIQALHYELLGNTAFVHQGLGNHQKAIELFEESKRLVHTLGFRYEEAIIISSIGMSQRALGRLDEALASQLLAKEMLRQFSAYTYPDFAASVDYRIALVQEDLKHDVAALSAFSDALSAIERIRAGAVPTETSRASISASRRDLFSDFIELLIKLKRENEAFDVAEHYRARAFLDLLAESRIDLREDLTPTQRERDNALFDRISAIQKERLKESVTPERQHQLEAELTSAENELEAFRLALRRENPRYASVQAAAPLSVERVQKELLAPDTVLLEFKLGEKRSFVWVVSQKSVDVAALPPRIEIERQVKDYRQFLERKVSALTFQRDLADYQSASRKLYQLLIDPIEIAISASRKLLIVPDGLLAYLPFETLMTNGSDKTAAGNVAPSRRNRRPAPLVERFGITYEPSASALAAISYRKREATATSKSLLAFGDPAYDRGTKSSSQTATVGGGSPPSPSSSSPIVTSYTERGFNFTQLPNTRNEVLAIGALYPPDKTSVYLGPEAREEAVKEARLDQYRYVHFAAHALIDDRVPARSGIVLSLIGDSKEDDVLQMGEIMRLKLNANMVTLSACSTGLGKLFDGEGMVGLTRAFLYAGADSVVVSLWNVNDYATAELMKAFYRNLNRHLPKDEALRQAKLGMLKGRRRESSHPYFWAPFVLVGEP